MFTLVGSYLFRKDEGIKPPAAAEAKAKNLMLLDAITAVALLVVGSLVATGVLHTHPAVAYASIGLGGFSLFPLVNGVKNYLITGSCLRSKKLN